MERKTCMCGYSTDKSNKWDENLDQCKKCTKKQNKKMQRIEEVQDYLDTFEIGELVCWRDSLHVLVEKTPIEQGGMWRLLDPTTTKVGIMGWRDHSDCPNIREIIYKWTDSARTD